MNDSPLPVYGPHPLPKPEAIVSSAYERKLALCLVEGNEALRDLGMLLLRPGRDGRSAQVATIAADLQRCVNRLLGREPSIGAVEVKETK